ncbi:MAG TPA: M14 metallopeptidase family protein [Phycisphaerae bacterium]|nr:M14 metallopeptidase family protein [Phycisphaerae bacterium]
MQCCRRPGRWNAGVVYRLAGLTVLLATGCMSAGAAAQGTVSTSADRADDPFALAGPVDANIPTPESIIGHQVGEQAVRYEPLVRYLRALADASPLVTLTPYAESHEGRILYYLTITSEANHGRLDAIRADNARLADPRTLSGNDEARRLLDDLPGVAWLAYAIHGDELSSTDAAMQVAYQLTAGLDEATVKLREDLVIHIDPLMNPDGRERYLGQLQHLVGKVPNPDFQAMHHSGLWSAGRGNHYLFDMNRDWLTLVHPETRGRAGVIQSWNPHLLVDSHEMGGLDTYLFDPPREPHNVNLSARNLEWRRRFSADQAAAFDRHGWSYYTQEWYEEWSVGYANAWANVLGAVGILYEQAGVNADAVKQATGQELTYGESVHHHVVSSLANLNTLRANRREIMADFLADRQWAVSDEGSGAETFLLPPASDRGRFNRLVEVLDRQGVESAVAGEPFEARGVSDVWGEQAETREFPAGTLIVRSLQPHRRLLHALLGFDPHMSDKALAEERKELEQRRGSRMYDIAAWNLAMSFGLEACWAREVPDVATGAPPAPAKGLRQDVPRYGYVIDGSDADVFPLLVRLLDRGCQPRVAVKPFTIGGREYQPGAVLLRRHENPEDLRQIIADAAADLTLDVRPADTALSEKGPDLGGNRFRLLQPPRVAVASQWPISASSFGSTWFALDQRLGLRASPINVQRLGQIDLRRYNVLILPHCWDPAPLGAVLDVKTIGKIKAWVESGGTLIALGSSAAFVAGKELKLGSVRLKRDVLDKLAVYDEAVKRERDARTIRIDPAEVWGTKPPPTTTTEPAGPDADKKPDAEAKAKPDADALKRADEWRRIFSPLGAMADAALDPEHWLCFGLGERLPVMLEGEYAYMSKHPVATPVRLSDEQHLRLSGLFWPEAREGLAGTAYATVEGVGAGQMILFAFDPFFRACTEGTGRLLFNAVVLGPGMGTSAPLPW